MLIPEGILEARRRQRAVGRGFRARVVRDFLVDEAGWRRRSQFVFLAGRGIERIFGFHWETTSVFELSLIILVHYTPRQPSPMNQSLNGLDRKIWACGGGV